MHRKQPASPVQVARHVRHVIDRGGSAPFAASAQRFFKETIQARGWRTAELRHVAGRIRRVLRREMGEDFLLAVADRLFGGRIHEEKHMAVMLLEKDAARLDEKAFRLFEGWLDRVRHWDEHDALVHNLLGPTVAAEPRRARRVLTWAGSKNRWRRRAACVALIRGVRQRRFFPEMQRVAARLLADRDDMVEKGLGWLLREAAKADPRRTVPFLMKIRSRASRLVLRTACETLPAATRRKVLATR
ncbi:MAG TPA: DNA alkylation repair protein [Terriglobales bacterium]|nr:DNA alkylation repair protein [Terriglobales bacterium]